MSKLIKTLLKDTDNVIGFSVKLDDKNASYENMPCYVEINKPYNRNVWEYDEAFITENALAVETDEDKAHATKLYAQKKGPKAYKLKETDNNVKLMQKDDKDVYMHTNHPEAFRTYALGKLHDSDEFHDLYKDWIKNTVNKFTNKYVDKDNN